MPLKLTVVFVDNTTCGYGQARELIRRKRSYPFAVNRNNACAFVKIDIHITRLGQHKSVGIKPKNIVGQIIAPGFIVIIIVIDITRVAHIIVAVQCYFFTVTLNNIKFIKIADIFQVGAKVLALDV